MPQPPEQPPASRIALAGILGITAAGALALATTVANDEGTILRGYRDPANIPTKCSGDTVNVVVGKVYTKAECEKSLSDQLLAHAGPVIACTPGLKGHDNQVRAAVNLAYNIGPKAYCGSTVARLFNAGNWRSACEHMMDWSSASAAKPIKGALSCRKLPSGKFLCVLPGLVKRRQANRALCLTGL